VSGALPAPRSTDDVIRMLRECGALLEGHFRLSSGLHSPFYLQCARLLMDPRLAEAACRALEAKVSERLGELRLVATVAPAMGGVVLGYELARQLGVLGLFVERVEGRFALRRGFALEPGARVLIAEDVVTTGLSTRECIACVREQGAEVVAAACLVDRSGGRAELGVPLVALATLDLPVYRPEELPPELAARPLEKPGSRHIAASHG
jgi:orotate phosphoribosyltransferase